MFGRKKKNKVYVELNPAEVKLLIKAEYSCAMKSHFRKFGNQSSGTRKSPILCLMTYPFLFGYWSRPCRICGT